MPSHRSGARAAARASLGIDGALALLRSHPLSHSLHVVVPSSLKEKGADGIGGIGGGGDVSNPSPPSPSFFDLVPKPPSYFCVAALNLAELTTPQFVAWAFPYEELEGEEGGACGLAAPASLDAGGGAALSPDGRLLLASPAEERRRAGDPAPGASKRDPGGNGGWFLSEVFLTAGRKARARAAREKQKKATAGEEAMEEEEEGAAATAATAEEHRPLAKARERLAQATLPVPFALLPPGANASSSSCSDSSSLSPPPPLPGAREVAPRERRRLRARAPLPCFPDFTAFFRNLSGKQKQAAGSKKRDRGGEGEEMEVDGNKEVEVEVEEATAASKGEEEEENAGDEGDDDDLERLTEALEWLGFAAALSAPSVTLVESQSEESLSEENFVDVCSFEGLLGSGFARETLEAAAAAVASDKEDLPWAALVLVGFPDSPLAWTEAKGKEKETAAKTTAKKKTSELLQVRLGPEACREHALFFVVVKGENGSCRFLAAVASGGGDGFASRLL